ncbi:MAG: hypothetical protein AAFP90_14635 [Planctomycetota bacterium]
MATITTTAAGNWNDANRYDLGRPPEAGDTVELKHPTTYNVLDASVDRINVYAGGTMSITGSRRLQADFHTIDNGNAAIGSITGTVIGNIHAAGGKTFTLAGSGVVVGDIYGGNHDGIAVSAGTVIGNATGSDTNYNVHGVRMFGGCFIGEAHGGTLGYGVFGAMAKFVVLRRCVGNGRRGFDGVGLVYVEATEQNGTESAAYLNNTIYGLGDSTDVSHLTLTGTNDRQEALFAAFANSAGDGSSGGVVGLSIGRLISGGV